MRTDGRELMDAMGDIDSAYIDEAQEARSGSRKIRRFRPLIRTLQTAAAVFAVSIILPNISPAIARAAEAAPVVGNYFRLVTFRHYTFEDDRHEADVEVNKVSPVDGSNQKAQLSASEVNARIEQKTDELIASFQQSVEEKGYQTLKVTTDVVTDNDKYYVVRLSCFTASADGYEENHYYVISKETLDVMKLSDLFQDGSDYVTVISDNIKEQMRQKMKEDENNLYFLDDDMPEDDFKSIAADQNFYINSADQLVIAFQEGDVAPMYMGTQEFVIPDEVIAGIRK